MKIVIIDYRLGNLGSVKNALDKLSVDSMISKSKDDIEKADGLILPGVGSARQGMENLKNRKIDKILVNEIKKGKPFLGICLGLQVLFESSEESPGVKGLGVLKGKVVRFKKAKKIPHVGWNGKFYFVHSYYVAPEDKSIIYETTNYDGEIFTSMIKKENLLAVQFHPEKSGDAGLELLKGFLQNA